MRNAASNLLFNNKLGQRIVLLLVLATSTLLLFNKYNFIVWDQIRNYHQLSSRQYLTAEETAEIEGEMEIQVLNSLNIDRLTHGPRILLTSPIFSISRLTGISSDKIFSINVLFNFLLSAFLLGNILFDYRNKKLYVYHHILAGFILVSLFMNGRLSYAFLGVSLLTWYFEKKYDWSFFPSLVILNIAAFMTSVSSGVLSVAYALIAIAFLKKFIFDKEKKDFKARFIQQLPLLMTLIIWARWFFAGIIKNLKFYNGSFWKMTAHGYGEVLHKFNAPVLTCLVLALVTLVAFRKPIMRFIVDEEMRFAKTAIIVSLCGGVYGYSVISAFFPCYLLLSEYYLIVLTKQWKT